MSKVFIDESTLTTIGNAIRAKAGTTELIAPQNMGEAITNLPSGGGGDLPEEAFLVTGNCNYKFTGGWDWFIRDYGNRITTKDIETSSRMFQACYDVESIPFELNFLSSSASHDVNSMFYDCFALKSLPKLINVKPSQLSYMFAYCRSLKVIPDDYFDTWDFSYVESQTSGYGGNSAQLFNNCYSLRSFPYKILERVNKNSSYSYTWLSSGFASCKALDELVDLPIPYTATYTSNLLSNTFLYCNRLKNITFAMPDGQPYVKSWKSQTMDLTKDVGYIGLYDKGDILNHNSGITADKEVTDDATYQALKNDPDWFTTKIEYCRYNHDSAVATINSLPDTSAYLASAGGTNTIKFMGAAGSATDGGAINTLTEAEIAVATAKGWTVTLS